MVSLLGNFKTWDRFLNSSLNRFLKTDDVCSFIYTNDKKSHGNRILHQGVLKSTGGGKKGNFLLLKQNDNFFLFF